MYTLKSIVRRGTPLAAVIAIVAASVLPAASAFADDLNPLTDRSLTLSSSAPGWDYKDGSGNTTYAPPNSGANGQKTGNTFAFKVSSSTPVKGMSFQYCTGSAGTCSAPGNNGYSGTAPAATRNADSSTTSDLNVVVDTNQSEAAFGTYVNSTTGEISSVPAANSTGSNYIVYTNHGGSWGASTGWVMDAVNNEDGLSVGDGNTIPGAAATGANNYITLTNTGGQPLSAGDEVKVVFFGTDTNYITNPGAGAFFVKINTYNSDSSLTAGNIVDGGVTVANVMNQSIKIQTKVLETMDFSVGTVDPNTLESDGTAGSEFATATGGQTSHSPCDRILTGMTPGADVNVLRMGDEGQENSLSTTKTYSTHSYWRLSSNSSGGATVYYSGVSLSNTVGDVIDPIYGSAPNDGLPHAPVPGMEQFGLALDFDADADNTTNYGVERDSGYVFENGADTSTNGVHATVATDIGGNPSYHAPQLAPLVADSKYDQGRGVVNSVDSHYGASPTTEFAFNSGSNAIPQPIATESSEVVDCVTGKMRYVANIAATTPAGIYTTAINYIAAPQY